MNTNNLICPKCGGNVAYYSGSLDHEALKCTNRCDWEYNLNAPDNIPAKKINEVE